MENSIAKKQGHSVASCLEVSELKTVSLEHLKSLRLNNTQDNYYQAAIEAKKLDSVLYLKTNIDFPLTFQNAVGNTVLHCAINAGDAKLLKLVIMESYKEGLLDHPTDLSDIKGNFKQGLTKCLLQKNDKGLTPLSCAIEAGGA